MEKISVICKSLLLLKIQRKNLRSVKRVREENIKGLVIDVRGNPGGYLNSVEEILGEIMTDKKPMLQVEQRNGEKKKFSTELKERKPYPISVLIDNGSASASEILAGALKEGEGYDLIGEKRLAKVLFSKLFHLKMAAISN